MVSTTGLRTFTRKWCVVHDRSIGAGGCCSGGLEQPCTCSFMEAVVVLPAWSAEPDYESAALAAYNRAVSDSEHGFPHPGSYDEPKARGYWRGLAVCVVDAALTPTTNEGA